MTENEIKSKLEVLKDWVGDASLTRKDMQNVINESIKALEEIQQYRAIGTVEEFKALKEKSTPKKPIDRVACKDGIITVGDVGTCPNCGHIVAEDMLVCEDCLQVLDWEGDE